MPAERDERVADADRVARAEQRRQRPQPRPDDEHAAERERHRRRRVAARAKSRGTPRPTPCRSITRTSASAGLSSCVVAFAPSRIAAVTAAIAGRRRSSASVTSSAPAITNGVGSARCAMPLIDGSSGARTTPVNASIALASSARPRGTARAANPHDGGRRRARVREPEQHERTARHLFKPRQRHARGAALGAGRGAARRPAADGPRRHPARCGSRRSARRAAARRRRCRARRPRRRPSGRRVHAARRARGSPRGARGVGLLQACFERP